MFCIIRGVSNKSDIGNGVQKGVLGLQGLSHSFQENLTHDKLCDDLETALNVVTLKLTTKRVHGPLITIISLYLHSCWYVCITEILLHIVQCPGPLLYKLIYISPIIVYHCKLTHLCLYKNGVIEIHNKYKMTGGNKREVEEKIIFYAIGFNGYKVICKWLQARFRRWSGATLKIVFFVCEFLETHTYSCGIIF